MNAGFRRKDNIRVVIIDYGLGNLFSVGQACMQVGIPAVVSGDKQDITAADALILPGVGAFSEAMQNLRRLDLEALIRDKVDQDTPIFGICLGQQLLFSESEEFGSGKGLNIIEGSVRRFPSFGNNGPVRIPQIAWNKIHRADNSWHNTPFNELKDGEYMYFVHSFFVTPQDRSTILSVTEYAGMEYASSISRKNIFATQFHPEKSALHGLSIYRSWAQNIGVYGQGENAA